MKKIFIFLMMVIVSLCAADSESVDNKKVVDSEWDSNIFSTYEIEGVNEAKIYLATTQDGGFLFGGFESPIEGRSRCNPVNKEIKNLARKDLPKEVHILCGDFLNGNFKEGRFESIILKNGKIVVPTLHTQFTTKQINMRYDLSKKIGMSYTAICSPNQEIQEVLNRFYNMSFSCENMRERFIPILKQGLNTNTSTQEEEYHQITISNSISYFDGKTLVVQEGSNVYNGGAHGKSAENATIFDYQGNRIDIESLMDKESPVLKEKLWNIYLQKYKPFIQATEFNISTTLTLEYDGIGFIYQPYEIQPYSSGIPHLVLPFKDAKLFFKGTVAVQYLFE
ncbi:hypothetical protein CCZ01_00400 [Helicobacter monodelphidis]|uniref:RsiV family protein n=1 Tax=Helicobacter sp. 15-1451 TaxID=2004995 RepID=UPI000DCF308F|nr:RsiV family protein [Helicobacter sp. 15-1451]RAX59240.1 hypothetical protein CCZ01_00400 [Helicobacter sp. 15-1451]